MKLEDLDPEILKKIIQENRSRMFSIIVVVFIVIVIVLLFSWIGRVLTLENRSCNAMNKIYATGKGNKSSSLTGIINRPEQLKHTLAEFYIKTAYNCCSPGNYKNSFVNLCALRTCIKQGARCLDFEIYSVGNEPVIATSTFDNCKIKETYNSVSFSDAIRTVNELAFTPTYTNVAEDPIFLHLRIDTICSTNIQIYDKMAAILKNILGNRLMPSLYGKGYLSSEKGISGNSQHHNFGKVPMANLMGRVIVMINTMPLALKICDPVNFSKSKIMNDLPARCKFYDLVNVIGDVNSTITASLHEKRFKDLQLISSIKDEQAKNMSELTICLPDLTSTADYNIPFNMCKTLGIQFVGLCFQTYDTNLELADLYFRGKDSAGNSIFGGGSIQLKPAALRPAPPVIVTAEEQPEHSLATRTPVGPDNIPNLKAENTFST